MVRKKKPVPKHRIYQHFAVATLAITLVVAMIMEGEGGRVSAAEALAQEREEDRKSGEIRVVERAPIFQRMPDSDSGWGSEAGSVGSSAYGRPIGSRGGGEGGGVDIDDATLAKLGLTRAEWNALPDSEKIRLLEQLNGRKPQVSEAERIAASKQAAAESRSRAGGQNYGSGGDAPD